MNTKIKIGMIGLGARGIGLLQPVFLQHPDVRIEAVCDVYQDRCESATKIIQENGQECPKITNNYKEILAMKEIDAVILCTSWDNHVKIAIEAMEAGKYVGCEVGGAYSIQECWKLVEAYERTNMPVMMLENCVYGRTEMMIAHMVELGVFGEIVHCEGGYKHDLRDEVTFGKENRH